MHQVTIQQLSVLVQLLPLTMLWLLAQVHLPQGIIHSQWGVQVMSVKLRMSQQERRGLMQ